VPFAGHGPVPAGLERRGDRPRLLVSHSTVPGPDGNTLRPVLAALAFGVPQLVIPGPGDRRYNAELVARRGAGLVGAPSRATITRLLADEGLRAAAAEVRAEIAAMPEPAEVAAAVLAGVRS